MTATVAASKAYDLSGGALREDLEDVVYDISPMDTFFMTRASRTTVQSTTHEWLTDSLAAPAANAQVEGDAFAAAARVLPSRLKNYTQISRKDFEVTRTAQRVNTAGFKELLAYHTARAAKEIKRDIETHILGNNPASAGSSVSPRVSAGVPNWLYTLNHIAATGQTTATTTAPVSGFATATIGTGSATAFTETALKSALQQAWSTGGMVDTILTTASLYNTISAFTGLATRFSNVRAGNQAEIVGAADVYVSAFGKHAIQISRYSPAGYVYCLDMSTWAVGYLDSFQTVEIAKIGDAERRMIVAEWSLIAKNPLANTKVTNVT